ncbi:uroporphyrinogen-III synthase [bacterium]|nr:uroporphyrinogen-III synthase [bacterium]
MKQIEIIFTGKVDSQYIDKILKTYNGIDVKQFDLLQFSPVINSSNVHSYADLIQKSTIICITSKKTVEIISQYPEIAHDLSKKKLVVSGVKVANFLKKQLKINSYYSEKYQGQRGVMDVLSKIVKGRDWVVYLHSNRAEDHIKKYFNDMNIQGQCKVVYETNGNEIVSQSLLQHLKNDTIKQKVVFFASPSAVHIYNEKVIKKTNIKGMHYLAFGQSTQQACNDLAIRCFFEENSKDYFETVVRFLEKYDVSG